LPRPIQPERTIALKCPNYLREYAELYADNPRGANLKWFREARYGLFLHYGLYSLTGKKEWVQHIDKIPVAEMATYADRFRAERFDATAIAEFACSAGFRYINLTTRHHDSFCLFKTAETDFNTVQTACGRDLVGELAAACDEFGLGLCLYYSHGRDWRHPHAPNNDEYAGAARPEYDEPQAEYKTGEEHDLSVYLRFMQNQITELLTQYGHPIASIWLDGIGVPLRPRNADGTVREGYDPRTDGDPFEVQKLYDHIHSVSPMALVSYKQGYLGTEDFYAPEHKAHNRFGQSFGDVPGEVCTTMIVRPSRSWAWTEESRGQHMTADEVWKAISDARDANCNLLLNSGPLPDGSLDPEDVATLLEVGERLARDDTRMQW